jgi:hypothetical protein
MTMKANNTNKTNAKALADQILAAFESVDLGDVVDTFQAAIEQVAEATDADEKLIERAARQAWKKVA